MARGWESKSVEQQQEERRQEPKGARPMLSAEERERNRKREGWELARKRLVDQLGVVRNPRHRQMLESALADLDHELDALK